MPSNRLSCPACGELIGMYEPAVLVTPNGSVVPGSRLTFDESQDGLRLHESCYEHSDRSGLATP